MPAALPTMPARLAAPLAALLALAPQLAGAAGQPPATWDGLERREVKGLEHVYVRPHVQFKAYRRVRLDPVQVEFDKSWDPNQGTRTTRLGQSDVQKLRAGLASEFQRVFTDTLQKGGYQLVDEDDEDVLRVSVALVNVWINAPDAGSQGPSRSYTAEPGRITLAMELRDAVTGQVLARVVDTTHGTSPGTVRWSESTGATTEAQQAFLGWSDRLRKKLDELGGPRGK